MDLKNCKVSKHGGHNGAPNYRLAKIDAMLEMAQEVDLFGSNKWEIVAKKFVA